MHGIYKRNGYLKKHDQIMIKSVTTVTVHVINKYRPLAETITGFKYFFIYLSLIAYVLNEFTIIHGRE